MYLVLEKVKSLELYLFQLQYAGLLLISITCVGQMDTKVEAAPPSDIVLLKMRLALLVKYPHCGSYSTQSVSNKCVCMCVCVCVCVCVRARVCFLSLPT